ncbi:MAG: ribonucleotide-diphosphate reductase subunit beta [Methylococcales bacterium]|nr:ribonucleotide-diphosphate reductase subunit beta [Methylococcales bacterium]
MTEKRFSINDRRLINGPVNNLMQIRPVKYSWAMQLLEQQQNNAWDQREVDLSEDAKQYATGLLTEGNLTAYKKALAFLSNLDGIQLNNLTKNIGKYITSPEVSMCITRQAWEEAQHVLSYAQMIESIGFDPDEIYWMFDTDPILAEKNEYITRSSEILGSGFSEENFVKAVVANIALEGIYFFNGFLIFYTLERQGLMRNSAKMIQLIQRDEEGTHLPLFINMWKTLRMELPHIFTDKLIAECRELIRLAAQHEIVWGKYIIREGVLGLTDTILEGFIQSLADKRLEAIGLDILYGAKNPITWFDDASKINLGETNFFEGKNASYVAGGSLEWD